MLTKQQEKTIRSLGTKKGRKQDIRFRNMWCSRILESRW